MKRVAVSFAVGSVLGLLALFSSSEAFVVFSFIAGMFLAHWSSKPAEKRKWGVVCGAIYIVIALAPYFAMATFVLEEPFKPIVLALAAGFAVFMIFFWVALAFKKGRNVVARPAMKTGKYYF